MSTPQRERTETEEPFLEQLQAMGWEWLEGDRSQPSESGPSSFGEVLLEGRLRDAIRRINLDKNEKPWLDDDRIGG